MQASVEVTGKAATAAAAQARAAASASSMPHADWGGDGRALHFLHANGYPPACYRPLIELLTPEHHVFGMLLRPLWPGTDPVSIQDWTPFSDDLRRYLHGRNAGPVIGMGHSMGAVATLRAALQEPELFQALILIDPVLAPPRQITRLRIVRALGLPDRLKQRARATLRRRRHFDDLEQLFKGYRRRNIFRYLSDEHLRTLIEGITRPRQDGGYELAYSPEWEAQIYRTAIWNDRDIWSALPRLRVPALIIRGSHTDTFWAQTARIVERHNPAVRTVTVPESTHLVALERPAEVARLTDDFLGAAESDT